jgi:hypothetical protein
MQSSPRAWGKLRSVSPARNSRGTSRLRTSAASITRTLPATARAPDIVCTVNRSVSSRTKSAGRSCASAPSSNSVSTRAAANSRSFREFQTARSAVACTSAALSAAFAAGEGSSNSRTAVSSASAQCRSACDSRSGSVARDKRRNNRAAPSACARNNAAPDFSTPSSAGSASAMRCNCDRIDSRPPSICSFRSTAATLRTASPPASSGQSGRKKLESSSDISRRNGQSSTPSCNRLSAAFSNGARDSGSRAAP